MRGGQLVRSLFVRLFLLVRGGCLCSVGFSYDLAGVVNALLVDDFAG